MNSKDIRSFVFWWNNTYSIDRWYRDRYKISWNSSAHRQQCLIDMYFEYVEEILFNVYEKKKEKDIVNKELLAKGIWLKEPENAPEISDDMFDKIDIFNSNKTTTQQEG